MKLIVIKNSLQKKPHLQKWG